MGYIFACILIDVTTISVSLWVWFTLMLQNELVLLCGLLISHFTKDSFIMPVVGCSDAALLVHCKYLQCAGETRNGVCVRGSSTNEIWVDSELHGSNRKYNFLTRKNGRR